MTCEFIVFFQFCQTYSDSRIVDFKIYYFLNKPFPMFMERVCFFLQDKVLINQWKDEIIQGFTISAQIMANMNKKASKLYGSDLPGSPMTDCQRHILEHRNSNGNSS